MDKLVNDEIFKTLQGLDNYDSLTDPEYIETLRRDAIKSLKASDDIKTLQKRNLDKSLKKIKVLELFQTRIYNKPEAYCKYFLHELANYLYEKTLCEDTIGIQDDLKEVLTLDHFLKIIDTISEPMLKYLIDYFNMLDRF